MIWLDLIFFKAKEAKYASTRSGVMMNFGEIRTFRAPETLR